MAEPTPNADGPLVVALGCDVSAWERGLDKAAQAVAASAAKTDAAFKQVGQSVAASSAKAEASVNDLVAQTLASLDRERRSIGKTADQIRLMEAAEKGATATQLAEIQKRIAANDRARVAAQKAQQAQQAALQGLGSSLGGGVLSQFATGGLIAGLTAVAVTGVKMGIDLATGIDRFNREMERSAKLAAELEKAQDRTIRKASEMTAAIADPAEKLAALQKQLKDAEKDVLAKAGGALRVDRELEGLTDWKAKVNPWEAITGGREAEEKAARATLATMEAGLAKAKDRATELRDAIEKIKDPMNDPAFKGAISGMTADLEKQVATWGKTADEVKIYDLRLKDTFGKATEKIDELEEKMKAHAETMKGLEAGKLFDDTLAAMEKERLSIGKTVDQLKTMELAEKGLTGVQVAEIKKRMDGLAGLKKAADLSKTFEDTIKGLDKEAAAIGKTADQVKLLELKTLGFDEKQLAAVEAKMKANADLKAADEAAKKMRDAPDVAGAAVAGSREDQKARAADEMRRGNPMVQAAQKAAADRAKADAEAKAQRAENNRLLKELLEDARKHPPVVITPF